MLFMHQITCVYIIVRQQNWKHTYAQIKQKKRFVNSLLIKIKSKINNSAKENKSFLVFFDNYNCVGVLLSLESIIVLGLIFHLGLYRVLPHMAGSM